ncbi:MAG: hypothetical protein R6V06_05665 [Kiritimatiellia bacterium]
MSAVSPKEKNMLMIIVVLILYSIAALLYRKQKNEWEKNRRIYNNALEKYNEECALIEAKDEWDLKYETMCALMPVFPYDRDVDTHWLNIMDTVASENNLVISRRQTGSEEEVGDVYEIPLECKNWEGTLESLVGFLYGLRKQGAMLDVRQIYVKHSSKPGYLRGTFSLYCAYMRGDVVEEPTAEQFSAEKEASSISEEKTETDKQKTELDKPQSEATGRDASLVLPQEPAGNMAVPGAPKQQKKTLRTEKLKKNGRSRSPLSADEETAAVEAALEILRKKAE